MDGIWSQQKGVIASINISISPVRITHRRTLADDLTPGTMNSIFKQAKIKER